MESTELSGPGYTKNICQVRQPERNLRNSDRLLLKVPSPGDNNRMTVRVFSHAALKFLYYDIKGICNFFLRNPDLQAHQADEMVYIEEVPHFYW